MAKLNPTVNNTQLDRLTYHPKLSSGLALQPMTVIEAATAFEIVVDLNGSDEIEFFIAETEGANNIATFNLTIKYYEDHGVEITSSEETLVIPETTAGENQYVSFVSTTEIQKATRAVITGTLPHTLDYTVTLFCKAIAVVGISGSVTETNSAAIKTATEATQVATEATVVATEATQVAVELIADAIYNDGDAFTISANKTMSMGGLVEPTDTVAAGKIVAMALDALRRIKTADFDEIAKAAKISSIFPPWERWEPELVASITNAPLTSYTYDIDVRGFNHLSLALTLVDLPTVKAYATNEDVDAASVTKWFDVSTAILGASSITTDLLPGDVVGAVGGYTLVRLTVASPLSTEDWLITALKWWS